MMAYHLHGKKISGVKPRLAVDTGGLPHAVKVTTADISGRDGAVEMLRCCAPNRSKAAKVLCDGGYRGENFADAVNRLLEAEAVKRNEPHTFAVLPKRRVVERSFAWLKKYRRLWENGGRKLHNALLMTALAFISLLPKRY